MLLDRPTGRTPRIVGVVALLVLLALAGLAALAAPQIWEWLPGLIFP